MGRPDTVSQPDLTRLDLLGKERTERRYSESICCEREGGSHTLQGEGTDEPLCDPIQPNPTRSVVEGTDGEEIL